MQSTWNYITKQQAHAPALCLRGGSGVPAALRYKAAGVCMLGESTLAVSEQISMTHNFVDHDPGGSDG